MPSKYQEKAQRFLQKGKLEAALEQLQLAWKEQPANDEIVMEVAELYGMLRRPRDSRDCYGYLFDKYVERGDSAQTTDALRRLQRFGPVEPKRLMAYARLFERQNSQTAKEYYQQALEFAEKQDLPLAVQCLQELVKIEPSSQDFYRKLGQIASLSGQIPVATAAYLKLGELLGKQGKWPEAVEAVEEYNRLLNGPLYSRLALAKVCLRAGRNARVIELLDVLKTRSDDPEMIGLLAQAYWGEKQLERAEELYWRLLPGVPQSVNLLLEVAAEYLRQQNGEAAIDLLQRMEEFLTDHRPQRECVAFAEKVAQLKVNTIPALEYACRLFDRLHLDSPLTDSLHRLFDAYFSAGEFQKALDVLRRLIDIDLYAPECSAKLNRLEGKADPKLWKELAARLGKGSTISDSPGLEAADASAEAASSGQAGTPNAAGANLQDLMLQAEIFLQYRMEDKARERLRRIAKLYPEEHEKNEVLRELFARVNLSPKTAAAPALGGELPPAAEARNIRLDLSAISEITRSYLRQGTVKGVLSTAVNEIGRFWHVSRCIAAMISPNQPPTMILEYIAPGSQPSDAVMLGKLVIGLQQILATQKTSIVADHVLESSLLAPIRTLLGGMKVDSLVALPFRDAERPIGMMILEQCGGNRAWDANDMAMLEALAEQIVQAVAHVRLRSLMKALAVTDEESGLLHRESYIACLLSEAERTRVQKVPLSVTLLRFVQTDRPLQEQSLDRFLKEFSGMLTAHLRQNDIAIRYDPDCIALILPGATGKDAVSVTEKLRKLAASTVQLAGEEPFRTAAGVAEAIRDPDSDGADTVTELINRVEAALHDAENKPEDALTFREALLPFRG